jgi:hypothetical protein
MQYTFEYQLILNIYEVNFDNLCLDLLNEFNRIFARQKLENMVQSIMSILSHGVFFVLHQEKDAVGDGVNLDQGVIVFIHEILDSFDCRIDVVLHVSQSSLNLVHFNKHLKEL